MSQTNVVSSQMKDTIDLVGGVGIFDYYVGVFQIGNFKQNLSLKIDLQSSMIQVPCLNENQEQGQPNSIMNGILIDYFTLCLSNQNGFLGLNNKLDYLYESQENIILTLESVQNSYGLKVYDIQCYYFDGKQEIKEFFKSFPEIKFEFEQNQLFYWVPQNYMTEIKKNLYCVSIKSQSEGLVNVLGNGFLRQYEFLFNQKNNSLTVTKSRCYGPQYSIAQDWENPSNFQIIISENPYYIVIFIILVLLICILIPICYQKFSMQDDQLEDQQKLNQVQFVDEKETLELGTQQQQNNLKRLNYLAEQEINILTLEAIKEATCRENEASSLQDHHNRELRRQLKFNRKGSQQKQNGNCINIEEDLPNVTLPNATNRGLYQEQKSNKNSQLNLNLNMQALLNYKEKTSNQKQKHEIIKSAREQQQQQICDSDLNHQYSVRQRQRQQPEYLRQARENLKKEQQQQQKKKQQLQQKSSDSKYSKSNKKQNIKYETLQEESIQEQNNLNNEISLNNSLINYNKNNDVTNFDTMINQNMNEKKYYNENQLISPSNMGLLQQQKENESKNKQKLGINEVLIEQIHINQNQIQGKTEQEIQNQNQQQIQNENLLNSKISDNSFINQQQIIQQQTQLQSLYQQNINDEQIEINTQESQECVQDDN
ncbi:Aspartic peptidase domain [Pseudocohnilembus persalinus]|uniref:Aspartic peptidase domain n=1 Tax=Pseudocohnilembus persalinus TaxID=266149 RepID=A0A0V0QGD0_PSEPJ|nr:Aspartic peptidase domain [Pseudocohnilembus persalinus]|eukprot:KRX01254.1 Aspartic peptidase domain [Pseudocohnilembus persalinus]